MADITAFSPAMAAQILQTAASKSELLGNKLSQIANRGETAAKLQALAATKDQIAGERKSAGTKAMFAIGGAGANVKASMRGEHLMARGMQMDIAKMNKAARAKHDRDNDVGGALRSVSQNGGVSNLVTTTGDMLDKTAGGAHQADQAKIEGKLADVAASLASQQKQSADAGKTASQKFFDGAVDFAKGLQQTAKAAFDRITQ